MHGVHDEFMVVAQKVIGVQKKIFLTNVTV